MTPVLYHEEAQAELDAAADYYAERDVDLAVRFDATVCELERLIADTPLSYAVFDQVGEVSIRRALLDDFPYALLYVVLADTIWVVAIMHLRREPGYWVHRV